MKPQTFTLARDGFPGSLYEPEETKYPGKALLVVGGGDGRFSITKAVAAKFAQAGLTALAVAYWNRPGLPWVVSHIPLETMKKPAELFHRRGFQKVGMWGISKGAEYALLCGSYFPELISAVAAVSPSSHVIQGFQMTNRRHLLPRPLETSPFTYQGKPLPYVSTKNRTGACLIQSVKGRTVCFRPGYEHIYNAPAENTRIPVERCRGPVLLLAAEQDDMWDSCTACRNIQNHLREQGFPYPVRYEHYPYGSHMLFPVRTAFSGFFRMERQHPEEYRKSCLTSFAATLEWIQTW